MSDFSKTYSNGEVTIVWKPDLCVHSTKCFRGLPEVFNPRVKPWIEPGQASTSSIVDQVQMCPSGALSIEAPPIPAVVDDTPLNPEERPSVSIQVQDSGPYLVSGPVTVKLPNGTEVIHAVTTALCSCGKSGVMPSCDCS